MDSCLGAILIQRKKGAQALGATLPDSGTAVKPFWRKARVRRMAVRAAQHHKLCAFEDVHRCLVTICFSILFEMVPKYRWCQVFF